MFWPGHSELLLLTQPIPSSTLQLPYCKFKIISYDNELGRFFLERRSKYDWLPFHLYCKTIIVHHFSPRGR